MKQEHMGLLRPGLRIFKALFTAGIFLFTQPAQAQSIIPASNTDNVLASGIDARNVNCDMLYNWGGGHLRAVAYDDFNTGNGFINLQDYSGGNLTIGISGAQFPDIVLGDDKANPGNDYVLGVVYGASVTFFETYLISGTGTGTLTATLLSSQQVSITGSATSRFPHIDLYPDLNFWINGWPSLHEFVITWSEDLAGSSGMDIFASTGDLWSPTLSPYYAITTGGTGMMSDVAAMTDKTVPTPFAYIPFFNTATSNMDLAEIDIAATSFTVTSSIASPMQSLPRIEAMGLNYWGSGWARYQIAYPQYNGSTYDMWGYNDFTGNTNLSNSGFSGMDQIHPAVSAGPGPAYYGPAGYGTTDYGVAWNDFTNNQYVAQSIDLTTGNVDATMPDYYIVNQNPMTTNGIQYYSPVAISSSSNEGSRLLTAWAGNGRVWYKYNSNTTNYKQTGIDEVGKNTKYNLYPNPATKELQVSGVSNATYTITDMTGRAILHGSISAKSNTIDVSALANGTYVAAIKEGTVNTVLKFAKQ